MLEELQPRRKPIKANAYLYDVLNSERETVCISIRRGDYITNETVNRRMNICSRDYFKEAVSLLNSKINNPVYIVFSDDVSWCRKNIDFIRDNECYFETGNDPVWEKLRLMYSCKHFIISNSTFSWWAQYLSQNPEKIVVSPNRWTSEKSGKRSPLIERSFVRIRV